MRALALLLGLLFCACAADTEERDLRSPSYDYAPDPHGSPGAGDEGIGADRQSTSDKLESGARVGSDGAAAPGWSAEDGGLTFDRKKVKGGKTAAPTADEDKQDRE